MFRCLTVLLALFSNYSCGPSRFVKPLDKKEQAVNGSLGGALFEYSNLGFANYLKAVGDFIALY